MTRKQPFSRCVCDQLEVLEAGEFIEADDSSIGSGGPQVAPCNWLQHWEYVVDPYHFNVLHLTHSGPQFGQRMDQNPKRPTFEFEYTRHGQMTRPA